MKENEGLGKQGTLGEEREVRKMRGGIQRFKRKKEDFVTEKEGKEQ